MFFGSPTPDLPRGGIDAPHRDLQQPHHALLGGPGAAAGEQRAVEHLGSPLLPDHRGHPPRQLRAVALRGRRLPRQQLQQQHAERVHVGAERRGAVSPGRGRRGDAVLADARVHAGREEDVGGLEVAVRDGAVGCGLLT